MVLQVVTKNTPGNMEAITGDNARIIGNAVRLRKCSNHNSTASNQRGLEMVHDTSARRTARALKAEAREMERDAATLAGICETEELGRARPTGLWN